MVSSDTARLGIIRRSRNPQPPPIIRYRDARDPILVYLADRSRSVNPLVAAEQMLEQRAHDSSESSFRQEDARLSIEVLHAIQGMANKLGGFDFHSSPTRQPKLDVAGVEVSIRADLLVHATSRGVDQIGAAVLRMTQDDAATDGPEPDAGKWGFTWLRWSVCTLTRTSARIGTRQTGCACPLMSSTVMSSQRRTQQLGG